MSKIYGGQALVEGVMMGGGKHLSLVLVHAQHVVQVAGHARAVGAVLCGELLK